MVWHVRLLSEPKVTSSGQGSINISATLTITTDLNDTFYSGLASVSVQLWQCNRHGVAQFRKGGSTRFLWNKKSGGRVLKINFTADLRMKNGQNASLRQAAGGEGEDTVQELNPKGESSGGAVNMCEEEDQSQNAASLIYALQFIPTRGSGLSHRPKGHHKGDRDPSYEPTVPIPELLELWSAPFSLEMDAGHALAGNNHRWVQRKFMFPSENVEKAHEHEKGAEGEDRWGERHYRLVIAEELGETIARHVWDAGIALSYYLHSMVAGSFDGASQLTAVLRQAHKTKSPVRAIELGSGTGIAGLALSQILPKGSHMLLTDLLEAQEILAANIEANAEDAAAVDVKAETLDWDEPSKCIARDGPWDIILVTDCTYNPDSSPALVRMLSMLAGTACKENKKIGGESSPLIVIAMKVRHEAEAVFFELMKERGFVEVDAETIPLPDQHRLDHGMELEQIEIYGYELRGP